MIDIERIRKNSGEVKKGIEKKGVDPKLVDRFLRVDEEWRAKSGAIDELRAEQNALTKELAGGKKPELLNRAQILKKRIAELTEEEGELSEKRDKILHAIPNIPFEDVTVGEDESDNKILREVGKRPEFSFKPKDYLELAESLSLIDVKKAAEVSGSRFGYLKNEAVMFEFGLVSLAFAAAQKRGFIPVIPPVMIRPEVYRDIGRIPEGEQEERYYLEREGLYLVGSAEHTLIPLQMGEVEDEKDLPRRYVGFSTCFRREAGSYGKDTRGILRVHQFDKAEFISFVRPEDSEKEHQELLSLQEELMQTLELPYRVVENCTGDMGWTDARQFDIEAWFPAEGKYRETHSCSNTTDFQTRGIRARYRSKDNKKEYLHALNATGFSQRPILALFENFQTERGTIRVPEALKPYVGKDEISPAS